MPTPSLLNKFTSHLRQSLKHSFKLALETQRKEITPLHLLYGLVMEKGSVASELLKKENIDKDKIVSLLSNQERNPDSNSIPKINPEAAKILERAAILALEHSHRYVGTEHLLAALVENKDADIEKILNERKITKNNLQQELTNVMTSINRFPEITSLAGGLGGEIPVPSPLSVADARIKGKNHKNQALEFFTTDLTSTKALKNMDPIIGREKEITRLIQILCRRQKNNPVLLGDPGVGKTAIVEGLAQKIAEGDVPDDLQGKKLLRLDLGLLIAGTIYRGEFEGRLKQLLDEIKSDPDVIVFIDELHTIVGAGSASGTLDAANILKPALARGEMRCIGATTFEEFKKHIESDPALERRFQSIIVNEPSKAETLQILKGISANYEKYHHLKISEEALIAAVNLSDRSFPEKFFPDKAIDLLDEASSAKKLHNKNSSEIRQLKFLERQLAEIRTQKQEVILKEDFTLAGELKKEEGDLIKKIQELENSAAKKTPRKKTLLLSLDIAQVVAQATGVPIADLLNEQKEQMLNLETEIKKKIIGQDEVARQVVKTLQRARLGISNPARPLASFLFVGPSGVGKTELAKVLAELYFPSNNSRDNFIRVDMSEFGESFHVSKLVGAPAGYVGYKEGNQLTDKIKHHPYSIILFDEIDKAHPDVFKIFLQILDEGHLTDAVGKKINFKNTIIILTANLGEDLFKLNKLGFGDAEKSKNLDEKSLATIKKSVLEDLKQHFRADFLNRLDQILVFRQLNSKDLENIADLQIELLNERLKEKNIQLFLSPQAKKFIAEEASPLDQGARAIYKVIQNQIEEPLIDFIMKNQPKHNKIQIELVKEKLQLV